MIASHLLPRVRCDGTYLAPLDSPFVAASLETELIALNGEARTLGDLMTTFPLVPVVLDPYTHESAWILDTARRILTHFADAGCRPCWILTSPATDAATFLGPYADEFLAFADPSRTVVSSLEVTEAPSIMFVRQDGEVIARAEGWNSDEWREVAEAIADHTKWTRPSVPGRGDPAAYSGTAISR